MKNDGLWVSALPGFGGRQAASPSASKAARGASRKRDTQCELRLRRALWRLGLRYRIDVVGLAGRPDIVFRRANLVVFCDGDFWHGRNLAQRIAKLERGHNAPYWVAKITTNVSRDRRHDAELVASGWKVLRYWETDILSRTHEIADEIAAFVRAR